MELTSLPKSAKMVVESLARPHLMRPLGSGPRRSYAEERVAGRELHSLFRMAAVKTGFIFLAAKKREEKEGDMTVREKGMAKFRPH